MSSESESASGPLATGGPAVPVATRARVQWKIAALVAIGEVAHLLWEHLHGGIQAHHLLNRADLPSISNAWGIIFLPALAWFLSGRIVARALPGAGRKRVTLAFLGALLVGLALLAAFTNGFEQVASYIFLGAVLTGVVVPVYRSEYVLGFVLGMTVAVGPFLATLAAAFIAVVSVAAHTVAWPALRWLAGKVRRVGRTAAQPNQDPSLPPAEA